jgi:hypothetical protein
MTVGFWSPGDDGDGAGEVVAELETCVQILEIEIRN